MGAALGWSVHSGWAVVVGLVSAGDGGLAVSLRRRVELISPDLPRMTYHAAEGLSLDEAAVLIARVEASVASTTAGAVSSIVEELQDLAGGAVSAAVLGKPTELPPLERILASHALLHAAEGVQYREAVQDACEAVGVSTTVVAPKTVAVEAEAALGWAPGHAAGWLATTGKALGPPWTKDHKEATLAAAIVLASR
jgi:hypothetical protein